MTANGMLIQIIYSERNPEDIDYAVRTFTSPIIFVLADFVVGLGLRH